MPIDTVSVLCAQLTRDLFVIAKFLLEINSDSVRNEFGFVRFEKKRFGSDVIVVYSGWRDFDVTDVTYDNK